MDLQVIVGPELGAIPGADEAIRAFVAAGRPQRKTFPNGSDYVDYRLPLEQPVVTGEVEVGYSAGLGYYIRIEPGAVARRLDVTRGYGGPGVSLGVHFHSRDLTELRFG